jgi:hypothetical protein
MKLHPNLAISRKNKEDGVFMESFGQPKNKKKKKKR